MFTSKFYTMPVYSKNHIDSTDYNNNQSFIDVHALPISLYPNNPLQYPPKEEFVDVSNLPPTRPGQPQAQYEPPVETIDLSNLPQSKHHHKPIQYPAQPEAISVHTLPIYASSTNEAHVAEKKLTPSVITENSLPRSPSISANRSVPNPDRNVIYDVAVFKKTIDSYILSRSYDGTEKNLNFISRWFRQDKLTEAKIRLANQFKLELANMQTDENVRQLVLTYIQLNKKIEAEANKKYYFSMKSGLENTLHDILGLVDVSISKKMVVRLSQ